MSGVTRAVTHTLNDATRAVTHTLLSHRSTYTWAETKPTASARSFRRGVVMLSLLVTAGADPMQVPDTDIHSKEDLR